MSSLKSKDIDTVCYYSITKCNGHNTVWCQIFVVQNFCNFHNKRSITKLFATSIWVSCSSLACHMWVVINIMTQLNFFKYFKASSFSPQVDGPLSHFEVPSIAIVRQISNLKKWWRAAIAALIESELYALPFSWWQSEYFITYWRSPSLYTWYPLTHEWNCNSPGLSITHSLLQCYSVRGSHPSTFAHVSRKLQCKLLRKFFLWKNLLTLRKFNTTKIWCHMVDISFLTF